MLKVTVYHNTQSWFMPYEDGHTVVAVACLRLDPATNGDDIAVAESMFVAFNADLDLLDAERDTPNGETLFLSACIYRLLRRRSLSVGDVVHIQRDHSHTWLTCDPSQWREIAAPANRTGEPLTAAGIHDYLAGQRPPA
jgi:hypothetical protein